MPWPRDTLFTYRTSSFSAVSITDSPKRSPTYQAECLVKALKMLEIERCSVVGFSYGGMIAFKMVELYPELVETGDIWVDIAYDYSISNETLKELGFSSSSELLLPDSVKGCKALLKVAAHKTLWIPDRSTYMQAVGRKGYHRMHQKRRPFGKPGKAMCVHNRLLKKFLQNQK